MPQQAYVLLTIDQYIKLNNKVSLMKGYDLGKSTQRVFPINPDFAKINIAYDEDGNEISFDLKCCIKLSGKDQQEYVDLIQGYELVDSVIQYEEKLTEILATDLTTDEIDWYLQHYSKVGDTDIDLLHLEIESRSILSDEAVNELVEKDITIITVSDEN